MTNTAEYKNYLFVKVPEDATDWVIKKWPDHDVLFFLDVEREPDWIELAPGSYQIIGKGDEISESDWVNIVDGHLSKFFEHDMVYKNYDFPNVWQLITATESGHSLLRSLGMEPGTCLVLKKQTKLK